MHRPDGQISSSLGRTSMMIDGSTRVMVAALAGNVLVAMSDRRQVLVRNRSSAAG